MRGPWHRPRREEDELPPATAGDDVLVAAAQRGDARAFALLFDRYQDLVLRYCFYRLDGWDEAGDAAQQIFADAFAGLKRFRDKDGAPAGSFRTWLFRIAHNEVADRHRRRARRSDLTLTEATEALAVAAELESEFDRVHSGLEAFSADFEAILFVEDHEDEDNFDSTEVEELRALFGLFGLETERRLPRGARTIEHVADRQQFWRDAAFFGAHAVRAAVAEQVIAR
jgi:RNA polymerase sigma-70 factor (ECF subfamily)